MPSDVGMLRASFEKTAPTLTGFKKLEIVKVIPDQDQRGSKLAPPQESISAQKMQNQDFAMTGFQPDFLRPVPEAIEITQDEVPKT